jgi:hypothetical protein
MLVTAYATHVDPPEPTFPHTLLTRRDRRDPEVQSELGGVLGRLRRRGDNAPPTLRAIRSHLDQVQTQVAFEVDDGADIAPLREWAEQSNALFFLPDQTLRDPDFRVLFHPTGREDDRATVPRFSHGQQRKLSTIATLHAWGVHTIDHLPELPADPEVRLPAIGDIIDRMASLLAVAVRSESVRADEPMSVDEIAATLPRAVRALTPIESAFLDNAEPNDQRLTNMLWRYECVPVLLWTLGLQLELPPPNGICDVPQVTAAVLTTNLDDLEARGWRRDVGEILDQADLMYRLHWALRNAQLTGQQPPDGIDASVVIERRWALHWLLDPSMPWDEISLDT